MGRAKGLHVAAYPAVAAAGAIGSVALMLRAAVRPPAWLLVGFIGWVLSPFALLLWANRTSRHWLPGTRAALQVMTLVVTGASLAIYGGWVDVRPAGAAHAFVFVAVPPATWVVVTAVVVAAALVSRRRR